MVPSKIPKAFLRSFVWKRRAVLWQKIHSWPLVVGRQRKFGRQFLREVVRNHEMGPILRESNKQQMYGHFEGFLSF